MTKRFLLVDDDTDDRDMFREALSKVDATIICHCTSDGKELFETLDSKDFLLPDIIYLDVNMSGMNGWECLTKLKATEAYRHIPVFMYSTSSQQQDADIALDMGALCFFTKPHDFNQLKEILEVIANNLGGNIMEAVGKYEGIKTHKMFACS
ncbi:MAG: response regulator [Bacteroidota bacterium]|nr:response regulator [Bacteroidota bacterium]